ncbi:MAG: hypothetical protein MH204_10985 [Fimbriimonadaceae bacterium]|nr:hypothetical protein [Fimbriimonadaceae bacterium]
MLEWEDKMRFGGLASFSPWDGEYTDVPGLLAEIGRPKALPIKTNCYVFAGLLQAAAASLGIEASVRRFSGSLKIQPGVLVTTSEPAPEFFNTHAVVYHDGLVTDANLYLRDESGATGPVANLPWKEYLKLCFGIDPQDVSFEDYVPRPMSHKLR